MLDTRVKVLVVDDSAVVRQVLTKELSKDPGINVVGAARDPYEAREMILKLEPHVLTLDIEMPLMDGVTFLKKLMRHLPIPTIIVSSLTQKGSAMALEALASGAVEVLCKPRAAYTVGNMAADLIDKIKAAAVVDIKKKALHANTSVNPQMSALAQTTNQIVAIGSSTGGTVALEKILTVLPPNFPGTVVCQHIPEHFSKSLADRINTLSQVTVKQAEDGDAVIPGTVLIAPGNKHMLLRRSGARYLVEIKDGPLVQHQKPSVDVLFRSVAKTAGANAIGVILTGMGKDGAKGLLEMKKAGSETIGQDEESCVVFGMPAAAGDIGAVDKFVSLMKIPEKLVEIIKKKS